MFECCFCPFVWFSVLTTAHRWQDSWRLVAQRSGVLLNKPIPGYRNHSDNKYSSPPRLSGFNALFMRTLRSCEISKYRSLRLVKGVLYHRNHSVQEMSTKRIIDEVSENVRLILINYFLNMYESNFSSAS